MTGDWLYDLPLIVIIVGTLLIFLIALGVGLWSGRRHIKEDEKVTQINTLQAATLGLLGLLLAFTFAMAADRYNSRRKVVVDEANAIETVFLRADMLPEPNSTQIQDLLREYVDTRVEFVNAGEDLIRFQQAYDRTIQLEDELWQQAIEVSTIDPHSVPTGLFVQALNESFDLQATRIALLRNRVPEIIIDLIYISAAITIGLLGYGIGISHHRRLLPTLITILLISMIILVIIDLDRPRRGLITVSQQNMIDLQELIE